MPSSCSKDVSVKSRGKVMEYSVWFPQGSLNHPAIALLRWIMEGTLLAKDTKLHIAFLEWRKAFDK